MYIGLEGKHGCGEVVAIAVLGGVGGLRPRELYSLYTYDCTETEGDEREGGRAKELKQHMSVASGRRRALQAPTKSEWVLR